MKKRVLISTIATALLLSATALQAKTDKKTLLENEIKMHKQSIKNTPKEIKTGLQDTFKALQELQMKKTPDAKKDLQTALESFQKGLKANPKLDMVPVDERVQAYEFIGTSKEIQKALEQGIKLLKENNTQEALNLLMPLKDELDLSVMSIPVKIYPVAVKNAIDALDKGDTANAYKSITDTMNSMVIFKTVIPTPLLEAQDLILEASKIDKTKREESQKLLDAAKESLKRAELLGYTSLFPKEYASLNTSIDAIRKEIQGKNEVEKLYSNLKNDIMDLISKVRTSKVKVENPHKQEKK
jgi:tetratricopeptide (TPR) repeat protein